MGIGVSTACFYPLETEKAFERIGRMGEGVTEVFFNSMSEIKKPFLANRCDIRDLYGLRVKAVHPFMSFGEPYLLFSEYERRFTDTLEVYKYYYEAANTLGADVLVIHGGKLPTSFPETQYFERFAKLAASGREYGVAVAQENVVRFRSQSPDFLVRMRNYIGDGFRMVLDLKQAVRAGFSPFDFTGALARQTAHIHISDHCRRRDCRPPGEGEFDFARLFSEMKAADYQGDYIIELYRHNFTEDSQILKAKTLLERML